MSNGNVVREWLPHELKIIEDNPLLTARELAELLPGRTPIAIGNVRGHRFGNRGHAFIPEPAVKAPGDYLEHLSAYLVDELDCLEIWLKWNGYHSYRELSRDELGWVTLLCTSKG